MGTLADQIYRDSQFGTLQELPRAGTSLESPWVFDATARELRELAQRGMVEVVHERETVIGSDKLIAEFRFRKIG